MSELLRLNQFSVSFRTYAGEVQAVRGVDFAMREGERVAIVGESGSGKSVMTQSIVKLLPPPAYIKGGSAVYRGTDLTALSFRQLKQFKGKEIAYVFQDPMTSLNPTLKVGRQIIEGIRAHVSVTTAQARERAVSLLREVGIPNPEKRFGQYPYQLSGGMRQRVMIAQAIAMQPKLLVADEPTTALDVTIQSQILGTLKRLNEDQGMALLLITHNMGIVAGMAQRVAVMYGGCIVETGGILDVFEKTLHPYTRCLLDAVPRLDEDGVTPLTYIVGTPPDMLNPPAGCPFAPRCEQSMRVCFSEMPRTTVREKGHAAACWLLDRPQRAPAETIRGRRTG
ncbi:MAG: ABC transporter ATP-binding protein [Clostridiales bacterium]|nr:ABC transporter ATP-binding protein [Clostridiales bacterium]